MLHFGTDPPYLMRKTFSIFLICTFWLVGCDTEASSSAYEKVTRARDWDAGVKASRDIDYLTRDLRQCIEDAGAPSRDNHFKCEGSIDGLSEEYVRYHPSDAGLVSIRNVGDKNLNKTNKLIIYFRGGPLRSSIRLSGNSEMFSSWDGQGVALFPLYPGMRENSLGIASADMARVDIEMGRLARYIREDFKDFDVTIVGESFGSYPAGRLAQIIRPEMLVLISSPFNITGRALKRYFSERTSDRRRTIDTSYVYGPPHFTGRKAVNRFQYMIQWMEILEGKTFVAPSSLGSTDCVVALFGEQDPIYSLVNNKDRPSGLKVFVYGGKGHKIPITIAQIDEIRRVYCTNKNDLVSEENIENQLWG